MVAKDKVGRGVGGGGGSRGAGGVGKGSVFRWFSLAWGLLFLVSFFFAWSIMQLKAREDDATVCLFVCLFCLF